MRRKIKVSFLVLNVLLVLCTFIAYASPSVRPQVSRIPGMLSLFFPVLFFLNLFTILFWLSFGKWYALISLVALGLGYPRIGNFIQPGIHAKSSEEKTIRLATYNIFSFNKVNPTEENAEQVVLQMVKDLGDPDILALQESVNVGRTDHAIGKYAYSYLVPKSGTLLLSRHPIIRSGQIVFEGLASLSGWADIAMKEDTVRVYVLHLSSNRITEESEQLFEEGKLQEGRTWITAGSLLGKYSAASARRAQQADVVRKHIDTCPHPVIVMGDFNDTPQSYAYATIRGDDLHDSFVMRGAGIGTTYAGSIPGLRIDYVLTDKRIPITHHEVLKLPYSDHYPVVAECVLN